MRRALIALALSACASPGFPPGGPDDPDPPALLGITPDSAAVNVRRNLEVRFQFNEVVSERPSGVPDLRGLVLISPREGEPRVDWDRSALGVRSRRDWRPNTVYTVTLLPGLQDLRGNVRREAATVVFSTGPTLPDTRVNGVVFDWVAGRPAAAAIIEAVTPDSVIYVGASDSLGRFSLLHLPAGSYQVRGFIDPNRNRQFDPREAFDSAEVTLTDTATLELYTFVHDSTGPRIETVTARDSVTLRVTFDKGLLPGQSIDTSQFQLVTADSTPVRIMSVRLSRPEDERPVDTAQRPPAVPLPPAPADTTTDSAAAVVPSLQRPLPPTVATLEVSPPMEQSATYVLSVRDIRNLLGITGTSIRSFTTGRRVPVPGAPGDSVPPPAGRPPP
jgi:hypothetical protein